MKTLLDAGETYALQFNACVGAAGAGAVNGAMSLVVDAASAGNVQVDTRTQGITVTLPLRTVTLNGSSTLAQTVVVSGANTTTTTTWTSPLIQLTSQRAAGAANLTLTNLNLSVGLTTTGGVASGSSRSGSVTLAAALPNLVWTADIATQGAATYDTSGNPIQGNWSITLPNNRLSLQIAAGTGTLSVDYGNNGTIDKTYTYTVTAMASQAQ